MFVTYLYQHKRQHVTRTGYGTFVAGDPQLHKTTHPLDAVHTWIVHLVRQKWGLPLVNHVECLSTYPKVRCHIYGHWANHDIIHWVSTAWVVKSRQLASLPLSLWQDGGCAQVFTFLHHICRWATTSDWNRPFMNHLCTAKFYIIYNIKLQGCLASSLSRAVARMAKLLG